MGQGTFDPPVGDQPQDRHQHVEKAGRHRTGERERDRHGVQQHRRLALAVAAHGPGQGGVRPLLGDEDPAEDRVGDAGQELDEPVGRDEPGGEVGGPIQAVTKGTSDSQKSRCRLAQRTPPLTVREACKRWW